MSLLHGAHQGSPYRMDRRRRRWKGNSRLPCGSWRFDTISIATMNPADFVKRKEKELSELVKKDFSSKVDADVVHDVTNLLDQVRYMFQEKAKSKIGEEVLCELEGSFSEFKNKPVYVLTNPEGFPCELKRQHAEVIECQTQCFDYVLEVLKTFPHDQTFHNEQAIRNSDKELAWLFCLERDVYCRRVGVPIGKPVLSQNSFLIPFCKMLLKPKAWLQIVNPFLHDDVAKEIKEAVFIFLEICVLRERIERLLKFCDTDHLEKNPISVVDELLCTREWDTRKHPSWLVLELHLRIQIRPRQYLVAKDLIENSRSISQLNMGEGKTRVIMPMLGLYWTKDALTADRISTTMKKQLASSHQPLLVRVTVLAALLDELRDALHQSLTASALNVKIFELPFNRDVDVSIKSNVDKILHTLKDCLASGGLLLVTPEHRLSLLLKYYELAIIHSETPASVEKCTLAGLKEIVFFPAIDLLDEADEILRHKFQLVYAIGSLTDLDCGTCRWNATMAVLRILQESPAVRAFLQKHPEVFVITKDEHRPHHFTRYQYIPDTTASDVCKTELIELLVDELFENLPFEFEVLRSLDEDEKAMLKIFVKSKQANCVWPSSTTVNLSERETWEACQSFLKWHVNVQKTALALRGILIYGVLFHCLAKVCHRDFGPPSSGKGKEMGIPYLGADTPNPRAEFSHPDIAIFLTFLSWYWTGLDAEQLQRAFRELINSGVNSAHQRYQQWFHLSRQVMTVEHQRMLDDIDKIDLTDESQLALLLQYFQFNYETVNYYVAVIILPRDTKQYSQNIAANPWDLAEGQGQTRGFSGTKDNKYVLPSPIKQKTIEDLMYTDGKMLASLATPRNMEYTSALSKLKNWKDVLDSALFGVDRSETATTAQLQSLSDTLGLECQHSVLLDAGGCMAGASNKEVATYILRKLNEQGISKVKTGLDQVQGVVYFDVQLHGWTIINQHLECELMRDSPILAAECFAFFDESRTRGADLQLHVHARALMTLSLYIRKDQVMQAFGRLRKLDLGQSVSFFGSQEVDRSIRTALEKASGYPIYEEDEPRSDSEKNPEESKLNSMHVLFWTIVNTVKSIDEALILWANQGATYCTVRGNPLRAPQDGVNDLTKFYGSPLKKKLVANIIKEVVTAKMSNISTHGQQLDDSQQAYDKYLDLIINKGKDYGGRREIERNVLDDEMERELQKEVEEEFIRVKPLYEHPASELLWDYSLVFSGAFEKAIKSVESLQGFATVQANSGPKLYPFEALLLETSLMGEDNDSDENANIVRKIWSAAIVPGEDGFGRVLATENFRNTLYDQQHNFQHYEWEKITFVAKNGKIHGKMDQYLRNPKFALYFHSTKTIVLLSNYEAHRIMQLFYKCPPQIRAFREPDLLKLPNDILDSIYEELRSPQMRVPAADDGESVSFFDCSDILHGESAVHGEFAVVEPALALHSRVGQRLWIREEIVAMLAIVNGDCMYGSEGKTRESLKLCVKSFLHLDTSDEKCSAGVKFAKMMVQLRQRQHEMDRSDLQRMIDEVGG